MPIGGFGGPSGRRVHSVERALSASTLLPTVAFAALGTVTVLLVVQMGISPLGAVSGPSARDGGQGVTMPRMSISIGPQRLQHSAPARDRETTTADVPTTLDIAGPVTLTIPPTRDRETTTALAPTGPTGPTTLIFARAAVRTIPPTRDRESTAPDAQSAAMTAAVTGLAVTNTAVTNTAVTNTAVTNAAVADVAVTNTAVIGRAVTMWEVTTAAVEPHVQACTAATTAPAVMYTLLAKAETAPAPGPEGEKSRNEDTSVTSVKTPQNTDATQASEHAKAAKSGP
jgi:hypothetical protein